MDYFWPIIIGLCLLGLYLFKQESVSIQFAFQQLASQYNGNVKHGIIHYPQLFFPHQDLTIQISAMPHEHGAFTYVHFSTHQFSEDCVFKIISRSTPTKYLETDKNLRKQKTSIEEFEKKFTLRAKHDDYLIALLTSEVCDALSQLDAKYSIEVRYIEDNYVDSLHNNESFRFDLHIDQVLTKKEAYEQLIQVTLLIVKQMEKIKR
ncbi:MAG: hypothetical protein GKR92_11620 [Gammaproteobacteria bacterium]|nr:MAG: hypothetical protein GKR92_11620 [Gammaproteobacteria bacterium]